MNQSHEPVRRHFSPWTDNDQRSCWICAHVSGYDGVHLWCVRHRLVVVDASPWWARGAGCDEPEPPRSGCEYVLLPATHDELHKAETSEQHRVAGRLWNCSDHTERLWQIY